MAFPGISFEGQLELQNNLFNQQTAMQNNLFDHQNAQNYFKNQNATDLATAQAVGNYNIAALNAQNRTQTNFDNGFAQNNSAMISGAAQIASQTSRSQAQTDSATTSGISQIASSAIRGQAQTASSTISGNAQTTAANLSANARVQSAALTAAGSAKNVMTSGLFGIGSAGLSLGAGLITGGLNYLYAKNLISAQAEAQRTNFDYQTGKAETAFQSSGLPSWLAFTGGRGAGAFPSQSQNMGGQNFFSSALPGNTSNLAWTGSQSQLALGVGSVPDTSP